MSIVFIVEPFYGASHKSWADGIKKYSSHEVHLFTMKPYHWKWRMYGGAITLAEQINDQEIVPDSIVCTDFVDLSVFKSLLDNRFQKASFILYFHENQLTYPWSKADRDVQLKRDHHYAFMNYTSALVANTVYFNSIYHLNSFTGELEKFLKIFPDYKNLASVKRIKDKSEVLYVGLELPDLNKKEKNEVPVILWNHRWEYDKNPKEFVRLIQKLKVEGIDFQLILLGERFKESKHWIEKLESIASQEMIFNGYATSKEEYWRLLNKANVLPVTSHQEFFGISVLEAVHAKVIPILPRRLTYPELLPNALFYSKENEFYEIVIKAMEMEENDLNVSDFKWKTIIKNYDTYFT